MSTVITGASGKLGRRTTQLLIERIDPSEVVLVSRTPDTVADLGAGEARFGDFGDPASLTSAFAGAERVLIISSDVVGARVEGHVAAINAAVQAGARHVLYTSLPNPTPGNPSPVTDDHRRTEEALQASGVAWTALRNALYADLLGGEFEGAKATGRLVHNEGDGRTTRVAREDCAAVAAAVLAEPEPYENIALDVTGPTLMTAGERAAEYARISGRDVEAESLDDQAYESALAENGLPPEMAAILARFGQAIRVGALDQHSDVVERLVGRPPLSLADIVS